MSSFIIIQYIILDVTCKKLNYMQMTRNKLGNSACSLSTLDFRIDVLIKIISLTNCVSVNTYDTR